MAKKTLELVSNKREVKKVDKSKPWIHRSDKGFALDIVEKEDGKYSVEFKSANAFIFFVPDTYPYNWRCSLISFKNRLPRFLDDILNAYLCSEYTQKKDPVYCYETYEGFRVLINNILGVEFDPRK